MAKGGFDVIIGNPPYGASFSEAEKDFIKATFKSASGRYDSYHYFIERAIKLLKNGALLGFITPDTWLTNVQTKNLRELVLANCKIVKIVSLPQNVFPEANVDTCIVILQREEAKNSRETNVVDVSLLGKDAELTNLQQNAFERNFIINQREWMNDARFLFNIYQSDDRLIEKIKERTVRLGKITEICRGINPYAKSELIRKYGKRKGTQIADDRIWHSDRRESNE
jgi:adenine-specific DNA-methyltransferase